jgi:hypothetical protein
LFSKRFKNAAKMSEIQTDIFNQLSATFTPETIRRWEEMVVAWNKNPKIAPNPYQEPPSGKWLLSIVMFIYSNFNPRNDFKGCPISLSKGRSSTGSSWPDLSAQNKPIVIPDDRF